MAVKGLCSKQIHKYWIILGPLGNIYEVYDNLTGMTTVLNLNHFWVTHLEVGFMFMKISGEKLY